MFMKVRKIIKLCVNMLNFKLLLIILCYNGNGYKNFEFAK